MMVWDGGHLLGPPHLLNLTCPLEVLGQDKVLQEDVSSEVTVTELQVHQLEAKTETVIVFEGIHLRKVRYRLPNLNHIMSSYLGRKVICRTVTVQSLQCSQSLFCSILN